MFLCVLCILIIVFRVTNTVEGNASQPQQALLIKNQTSMGSYKIFILCILYSIMLKILDVDIKYRSTIGVL